MTFDARSGAAPRLETGWEAHSERWGGVMYSHVRGTAQRPGEDAAGAEPGREVRPWIPMGSFTKDRSPMAGK